MRVTKRPYEDLSAQGLRIKYVDGKSHATTARRVCKHCTLRKADDVAGNVSTRVRNDVKIYRLANVMAERDEEVPF